MQLEMSLTKKGVVITLVCVFVVLAVWDPARAGCPEQAKLTASDGPTMGQFGCSVSVSGDYCVVGAYGDDDNGMFSGSAYIFKRDGASWIEQDKLTASDGAASDFFGYSVSIDGDYCVIGAFGDDDKGDMSGSAYIFKRDGENWTQQDKLRASDGAAEDHFGRTVSISGEYCVIGAPRDDDKGDSSGSAYIFKRDGTSWIEQPKLTASDGDSTDSFGSSVSIDGDYAIVGAVNDDDKGNDSGSAYVFKRDGASWAQRAKLTASDGAAGDLFANCVSISGNYCLVGAVRDDDNGDESGSAYVFQREGASWTEQAKLTAAGGDAYDSFGHSASISGDYCLIGADEDDDNGLQSGSAYLFERDGTNWTEQAKLVPSDGDADDYFGNSVSIDGDYYVAGAYRDENMGWSMPGSAYVFSHELGALVGLEITGPNEAPVDFTTSYVAIAHYDNGCTGDVTDLAEWLVEPNAIASIEAGLLRTEDINMPQDVNIYAEYTDGVLTSDAQMTIHLYLPTVVRVPADYDTIQAGIDAARNTDTVLVADGNYTGDGNRGLDFNGKAITVRSENGPNSCIIDHGDLQDFGFHFQNNEDGNSVVDGFTITNTAKGICCRYSSPTIINCRITDNGKYFGSGGGMYFYRSSPTVSNCIISHNKSAEDPPYFTKPVGAGIRCAWGSPVLTNCIISGNVAEGDNGIGGAVSCSVCSLALVNCTITGNWAGDTGGAIACYGGAVTISNCIVRDNYCGDGNHIYLAPDTGAGVVVDYSDVQGGWAGQGNIDADPCFAEPGFWGNASDPNIIVEPNDPTAVWVEGDYHLLAGSPCIDGGGPNYMAGPNETDIDGEPRVMGGRVDMGADEAAVLSIGLNMESSWMYQNLPGQTGSNLTAGTSITYDPNGNSNYGYEWEIVLAGDVSLAPVTVDGGGAGDAYWTFAARGCDEPGGLSDSGQTFTVRVTVTGDDYGNTGQAEAEFGIALLGDVNNDGVVELMDRAIVNGFWRTGSAGPFSLRDCDLNCDGEVELMDRIIANVIWRGGLGQDSVSSPCPFR